jgi:lipoprotein-releasing system permease protein
MQVALFLARRYFLSKQKTSFINILSIIAMLGLATGTAALVIVLSAFNGMQGLIRGMYGTFDPDLKIVAAGGKSFPADSSFFQKIKQAAPSGTLTKVVEDNALALYQQTQRVVKVKGVTEAFLQQRGFQESVLGGRPILSDRHIDLALVGAGIYADMGISIDNPVDPLQVWYPKGGKKVSLNPNTAFNKSALTVGGVFSVQPEYDQQYVIVPFAFAEELFELEGRLSALELRFKNDDEVGIAQSKLLANLGEKFKVLNQDEQHADLLKILTIEKLFVFLALSIILLIASFNIFVALNMLVLDKQDDIRILKAMGANEFFIKAVFSSNGMLIAFSGAFLGMAIGYLVCFLQQQYELVSLGFNNGQPTPYPVLMQWSDFFAIASTIVVIGIIATIGPANKASKLSFRKV